MMKITYIGKCRAGQTCQMRCEVLKKLLPQAQFTVIDTLTPEENSSRIARSLGYRWKCGPFIRRVNRAVIAGLPAGKQDLIWVDKAVFLTPETTSVLRERSEKLVHFTPDPAFSYHRSLWFFKAIKSYDYLITTKKYEISDYLAAVNGDRKKILYATQGYQRDLHFPRCDFAAKNGVVIIGHYEPDRARMVKALLQNGIEVILAGINWEIFAGKNSSDHLRYLGRGIFAEDYAATLSSGLFAWGTLSRIVPEKHTTRTLEIPACGTALLTEKNEETALFFKDDEVIFYSGIDDMIGKIRYYEQHREELRALTEKGTLAVQKGGFDYESIMKKLLTQMGVFS